MKSSRHDLEVCGELMRSRLFAESCYYAYQAVEKALKSVLYRMDCTHSALKYSSLSSIYSYIRSHYPLINVDNLQFLDSFYLRSRYPNQHPMPNIPSDNITEQDANKALKISTEIVNLVNQ